LTKENNCKWQWWYDDENITAANEDDKLLLPLQHQVVILLILLARVLLLKALWQRNPSMKSLQKKVPLPTKIIGQQKGSTDVSDRDIMLEKVGQATQEAACQL
jgi:hypothetical protein